MDNPTMRVLEYTERTAKPKAEAQTDFASLSDFEKLKSDVEEMKQHLKSQIKSEKGRAQSERFSVLLTKWSRCSRKWIGAVLSPYLLACR